MTTKGFKESLKKIPGEISFFFGISKRCHGGLNSSKTFDFFGDCSISNTLTRGEKIFGGLNGRYFNLLNATVGRVKDV